MTKGDLIPVLSAEILKLNPEKKELLVFCAEIDAGFRIDGFAAVLCAKMDGQRKLSELVADLSQEWNLPKAQLIPDVELLLKDLEENKMLLWLTTPAEI